MYDSTCRGARQSESICEARIEGDCMRVIAVHLPLRLQGAAWHTRPTELRVLPPQSSRLTYNLLMLVVLIGGLHWLVARMLLVVAGLHLLLLVTVIHGAAALPVLQTKRVSR